MSLFLLSLYIALIFIRPMDWWEPVRGWETVNLTAIATLLAAMPRILADARDLWRVPQVKVLLALLAAVPLSWSYPRFWFGSLSAAFTDFGKTVVVCLLVVLLARNRRNFRILLWTILFCCAWMAVHAILQIQQGAGFGGQQPIWRPNDLGGGVYQAIAFGIFSDPNDLCLVFVLAIPLLWAEYRANTNVLSKILSLGLIPLMGYGAWLTNSRGGIVGIFGMLAAYAIARAKGIRRWLMASGSILLVVLILPARGAQLGMADTGRLDAWGIGIQTWQQYPLFGAGYGSFADLTGGLVAHNSYVNALTELGLVGYLPWALLLYLTLVHLRRTSQMVTSERPADYFHLTGLFSALTGYLTAIYFLTRTYNPVLYIVVALAVCKVNSVRPSIEAQTDLMPSARHDIRNGLWVGMASIPLMWITIRLGNAIAGR